MLSLINEEGMLQAQLGSEKNHPENNLVFSVSFSPLDYCYF